MATIYVDDIWSVSPDGKRTNLILKQGETFDEVVTHETTKTATAARFVVRPYAGYTDTLLSWTTAGGQIVITQVSNPAILTFAVAAATTAALDWDNRATGEMQMEIDFSDGSTERSFEGLCTLSKETAT